DSVSIYIGSLNGRCQVGNENAMRLAAHRVFVRTRRCGDGHCAGLRGLEVSEGGNRETPRPRDPATPPSCYPSAHPDIMETLMVKRSIAGGGGVRLAVYEGGTSDGPALLFIHGCSQSHRAWSRQFDAPLLQRFRLAAFDLRGHGGSDKPAGVYGD